MKTPVLPLMIGLATISFAVHCTPESEPPVVASLPVCGADAAEGGHITRVVPADGDTRVLRSVELEITLDEEIDCAKLDASRITLATSDGAPVPITAVACAGVPTTLSFQPRADLGILAEHTLVIDGLKDASGTAIDACQVQFTTKAKTASVLAGDSLNVALDVDGTLWSWSDPLSQSAHGGDVPATVPMIVDLPTRVVSMAAGLSSTLIVLDDGSAWAWGDNNYGQLGDGTTDTSPVPVKIALPAGVKIVAVAAANAHALALREDGRVMAWGGNDSGQLGLGTVDADKHLTPVEIPALTDVIAIAAGSGNSGNGSAGNFSLALKSDGTVWGWGGNAFAQIAQPWDENHVDFPSPTEIAGLAGIEAIEAGFNQGFALDGSGKLFGWGDNFPAALGNGACGPNSHFAPMVVPLDQIAGVSAAGSFAVVAREDGSVWAWGSALSGVIGDGTMGATVYCTDDFAAVENLQTTPKQAPDVKGIIQVSAAPTHVLVLDGAGTVLGVGYNSNDRIGLGAEGKKLGDTDVVATYAHVRGL